MQSQPRLVSRVAGIFSTKRQDNQTRIVAPPRTYTPFYLLSAKFEYAVMINCKFNAIGLDRLEKPQKLRGGVKNDGQPETRRGHPDATP